MWRNCVVTLRCGLENMSKKFKSDSLKKTVQNHAAFSKLSGENDNSHQGEMEVDNQNETVGQKYKFKRFTDVPVKSPNDKKVYSVIQLENGLTALLISDVTRCHEVISDFENEETENAIEGEVSENESEGCSEEEGSMYSMEEERKKEEKLAACSLTVGVGSFSDPEEVPGMAHFVEHMLFMGSEKYPEENYFDSFIKKLGGSDNASTECESTNFYFECPDENLSKAMDVFSNLFVSPLMTESAMLREREAVESEFIQNMPNDHYRHQQILMTTAVPGNPAGKFVWGNLKTLKDNVTDSYLYEATHSFWKNLYSSHKMTVAVQARLPLDTLEKIVAKHFSNVPCCKKETPVNETLQTPFSVSKFNKIYYIESVKDNVYLELGWIMPPIKHLFKSKPTNYLSYTIGHEGKGSLISYLRKNHWAVALTAGHDDDDLSSNNIYAIFVISISLTELGAKNLDSVLCAVFSYISMMQSNGPVERIYREMQDIANLNFRFEEESPAAEYTELLSNNMQIYPIENYITGGDLLFDYCPDEISKFVNCLTPSTVNITLSRKQHSSDIHLDTVEPWFKTKYTCKQIPDEWIRKWVNIKPYHEFYMPEPNQFIATDFSLHSENSEISKCPEKIFSSNNLSIWYKPDIKFKLPIGFIGIQFINKHTYESVLDNTLLKMYVDLLSHTLIEELYPSTMALLEHKISDLDGCLIVEIYGFNEIIPIILEKISEYIHNFNSNVSVELVEMYKETKRKHYFNNNYKITNLSRELRLSSTLEKYFTSADKYNVVSQINLEVMKKFSEDFYKQSKIQCLVQGNFMKDEGLIICQNFVNKIHNHTQMVEEPLHRVYQIPNAEYCCKIKSFDPMDANCVTVNFYQIGAGSPNDYCTIDLLMLLIEEPLFDQLRTQEQLGYDISCSLREVYGIVGFTVTIVSQIDKQSIDHVEERITNFLNNYLDTLREMPISEFNRVVKSLIALKQCCDLHLKEEVHRNWAEIRCKDYSFNRLEIEQKVLAKLTIEDVITLLEQSINPTSPRFRKLTIQIEGYDNTINNSVEETSNEILDKKLPPLIKYTFVDTATNQVLSKNFITDINQFKAKLDFYPENRIFNHTIKDQ